MALYKHKIDFDPADAANHDQIGSYILGAAGEVATVTDLGGGVLALDVNVGNMILDSDAGVFLEDSAAAGGEKGQNILLVRQDTLAISTSADGDFGQFKSTAKGELYIKDADALAMLTTIESDLDAVNANLVLINTDTTAILADTATIDSNIASLVKTEDVAAGDAYKGLAVFAVRNDAGTSLVSADGDFSALSLDADGLLRTYSKFDTSGFVADDAASTENPLLIGAVAHTGAAALSSVSASLDKVHFATDLYRRMWVNDSCAVAWKVTAVTVGTSAVQLDATPLAGRRKETIQNLGDKALYIKNDNTVSTANGIMIPKYSERDFEFSAALPLWAVSTAAGQDVRFVEAA